MSLIKEEKNIKEFLVVGKSLPKVDAIEKVTGTGKYTVDIQLPKMLYGKILRSPYPHAKILKVDTSKAEKYPGVIATLTIEDVPRVLHGAGPAPYYMQDEYTIDEKVRYVGDKVAAVAAVSEEIAEEALELIDVEYEVLPAVFDPEKATKADAPSIHGTDLNLALPVIEIGSGDIEKGFKEADYVFEDEYKTPPVQHCCLEPHVSVASWDLSGNLTVWSSTQGPFRIRSVLARALQIPVGKIRVIAPHVGGGFGSKGTHTYEDVCAFLAKKAGRPVKLECARDEVFTASCIRHPTIYKLKTGVKKDGTFTARQAKAYFATGAYANAGPIVVAYTGDNFACMYKCPNVKFEGYCAYTNTEVAGAFRGFGDPQTFFAVELQMDTIAEKLGIDPMELRLKNHIRAGTKMSDGLFVTSCGLSECIEKGAEAIGWNEKRKWPKTGDKKKRGIGMALGIHKSGVKPGAEMSSAFIRINEDGTINLLTGTVDVGQGSKTALAQIAAEELGVRLEDVNVTAGDTAVTPYDEKGAIGSRQTYVGGGAVKKAAADAKQQLLEKAAKMLEAAVEDLEVRDRRIYVEGAPETGASIAEVVMFSQFGEPENTVILGRGSHSPSGKAPYFMAQFAEVEVDIETGQVKVLRIVAAQDVGFAINPLALEGQIEGALAMGCGYALTEELLQGPNGKILNDTFLDYKIYSAMDMPKMETIIVESIDPTGPFGAKGAGEGACVPTAAAIANAIYNATGLRIKEIPITPEKILKAVKEKA